MCSMRRRISDFLEKRLHGHLLQRMLKLVGGFPAAASQEPDSKRARVEGARARRLYKFSPSSSASIAAAFNEACKPVLASKIRPAS